MTLEDQTTEPLYLRSVDMKILNKMGAKQNDQQPMNGFWNTTTRDLSLRGKVGLACRTADQQNET